MKTIINKVLIISLLTILTGCITANFQSNVKADAKPEFRRILIVSKLSNVSQTYLPTFQTAFPAGYQVCTVSSSPIAFESPEESIEKQRQTCQSEVILTIDFNRNYTTGSGKYISSYNELLLEMTDLTTGKPFWKALVTTGGSSEVPPRQIVNQLIKDGIIEGTVPL
ncbi:hypothetical protein EXU85_30470 [Spirosoma sp. KCTC 42546]|uniref:hypothetical protein n=1 Tax=Spirosoma sp. KCTC 42546 TaxID=2520506 RepID=UPI001157FC45|nr:hypothetical protein [Spirosoma sp. KCTC 42546]QDK82700.1 hypothetical protein EXU85_30470 [Spirosoma sp. KCTC 42546]